MRIEFILRNGFRIRLVEVIHKIPLAAGFCGVNGAPCGESQLQEALFQTSSIECFVTSYDSWAGAVYGSSHFRPF